MPRWSKQQGALKMKMTRILLSSRCSFSPLLTELGQQPGRVFVLPAWLAQMLAERAQRFWLLRLNTFGISWARLQTQAAVRKWQWEC